MKRGILIFSVISSLLINTISYASVVVPLYDTHNPKQSLGTITATNTAYGLLLTPNLQGLSPGLHGFHLHVNPSCDNHGLAAGGHFDPQNTGQHNGPYVENSHLGDLPALFVDQNGKSTLPVLAPRLTENDLQHHAIMIHQGGDNYSDHPLSLGGGGARVACGVVQSTSDILPHRDIQ